MTFYFVNFFKRSVYDTNKSSIHEMTPTPKNDHPIHTWRTECTNATKTPLKQTQTNDMFHIFFKLCAYWRKRFHEDETLVSLKIYFSHMRWVQSQMTVWNAFLFFSCALNFNFNGKSLIQQKIYKSILSKYINSISI